MMKVIVLGSGTSAGVPVIGCHCRVCGSSEPKNHRTRASIAIQFERTTILIDTAPEMRLQLIKAGIDSADAVLYTHMHADHLHGFDDLRAFTFRDPAPIPVYVRVDYCDELKSRFSYAFNDTGYRGAKPMIDLRVFDAVSAFKVGDLNIEAIELPHGAVTTSAFKIGSFVYATDFKNFSDLQIESWRGEIDTMIASGIHFGSHETHSVIPETVALFQKLQVRRGIISHLAHQVDYHRDSKKLPHNVEFAYDNMNIYV